LQLTVSLRSAHATALSKKPYAGARKDNVPSKDGARIGDLHRYLGFS